MIVVEVRANSRHSCETLCDSVIDVSGRGFSEILARGDLVHGVPIGVEEADRDGVVFPGLHRGDHRVEVGEFDRRLDRAVGAEPLGDDEDVAPLDQAFGLPVVDREDVAPVVALDRVDVAEVPGGDQRHARALPLQHRVEADGGAVDQEVRPGPLGHERLEAFEHGARRVLRRRRDLAGEGVAGLAILEHEVGEGAADIGGDAVAGGGHCVPGVCAG